jgi:hypothetical protein
MFIKEIPGEYCSVLIILIETDLTDEMSLLKQGAYFELKHNSDK